MSRVAGFAKITDYMVGMQVDGHSGEEYQSAENEERRGEPVGGVSRVAAIGGDGSQIEEPSADHVGVEEIEGDSREDDGEWHPAFPPD